MKFHNFEQGSPEWHEFRRTHIGASEAAIILGISPYGTADELLEEKVSGKAKKSNWAMERGTALEPEARRLIEQIKETEFEPCVVTHDEHEWLSASLDGFCKRTRQILEIKCGSKKLFDETSKGVVPDHYLAQLQHQMLVVDAPNVLFCAYWDGLVASCVVPRQNDHKMSHMLEKLSNFYLRLVARRGDMKAIDFEEPKEELSNYLQFSHERASAILAEVLTLCDEEKAIKARKEQLKEALYEVSPDSNFILDGVRFSKTQRPSYDYKRMALDGIDIEKYRTLGDPFWTIKPRR